MTEKQHYCLNCNIKMECIIANLKSDIEICLKEEGVLDD